MPSVDFLNAFSGTLGESFLGPKYDYHTKIRNPKNANDADAINKRNLLFALTKIAKGNMIIADL